jgi:hypothetical protein
MVPSMRNSSGTWGRSARRPATLSSSSASSRKRLRTRSPTSRCSSRGQRRGPRETMAAAAGVVGQRVTRGCVECGILLCARLHSSVTLCSR